MNVEEEFKKFLYGWVEKEYGVDEDEDDLIWVEKLAHDLTNEYWNIRHRHELENIKDDILMVARDNDIDLTDKEAYTIACKYETSEAYCAPDRESIKYFIEHYKGEE